jgi:hypothetical protein
MVIKSYGFISWLADVVYCDRCFANGVIAKFDSNFANFLTLLDFFSHTVIAVNRFTAIKFPINHRYVIILFVDKF